MAASRVTVHFPCPVERVWQTVTDLMNTAWRGDLARVEILNETHFVEHTKSGYATNFTVTACEPLCRWAFTMENGSITEVEILDASHETKQFLRRTKRLLTTVVGIFETAEGGARLTCIETVNAKHWWMRPLVPGYLKRQQKRYLDDLRRELQK